MWRTLNRLPSGREHIVDEYGGRLAFDYRLSRSTDFIILNIFRSGVSPVGRVFAGRNGETVEPFGSANGKSWVVHAGYVSGRYAGESAYDLGLVTLDRPLGNTTGYLGVTPLYPDSFFDNGGTLSTIQYPGDTQ